MDRESVKILKSRGRWWPVTTDLSQVIDAAVGNGSVRGLCRDGGHRWMG
jgi:hypothetical protein